MLLVNSIAPAAEPAAPPRTGRRLTLRSPTIPPTAMSPASLAGATAAPAEDGPVSVTFCAMPLDADALLDLQLGQVRPIVRVDRSTRERHGLDRAPTGRPVPAPPVAAPAAARRPTDDASIAPTRVARSVDDPMDAGLAVLSVASGTAHAIRDRLTRLSRVLQEAADAGTIDRRAMQATIASDLRAIDGLAAEAGERIAGWLTGSLISRSAADPIDRARTLAIRSAASSVALLNLSIGGLGIAGVSVSERSSVTFALSSRGRINVHDRFAFALAPTPQSAAANHVFEFTDGTSALRTRNGAGVVVHAVPYDDAAPLDAHLASLAHQLGRAGLSGRTDALRAFIVQSATPMTAVATTANGITAGSIGVDMDATSAFIEGGIRAAEAAILAISESEGALVAQRDFLATLGHTSSPRLADSPVSDQERPVPGAMTQHREILSIFQ